MKLLFALLLMAIALYGCRTARPVDPVCYMRMNANTHWTNFSISNGDTVWFCNQTCKTLFDTNPLKYEKKILRDRARQQKRSK